MKARSYYWTWICDGCGYAIAKSRESVERDHVILVLEGVEYHFHRAGARYEGDDCLGYFQANEYVRRAARRDRCEKPCTQRGCDVELAGGEAVYCADHDPANDPASVYLARLPR